MEWTLESPALVRTESDEGKAEALAGFAAGLAHDFNNLLTIINGYGELALRAEKDDSPLKRYMREILAAGQRAAELMELIMAFAGRQVLRTERVEVNDLLRDMRECLSPQLGETVSVGMRLCRERCSVNGDKGQLRSVLLNLILNAKEAMAGGGRLDLSTRYLPPGTEDSEGRTLGRARVEITVADTGCGMPEDRLSRIFDPYFTTKTVSNRIGVGMGLPCAQGIIRSLGGTIRAMSEPGRGSAFSISLPAYDAD